MSLSFLDQNSLKNKMPTHSHHTKAGIEPEGPQIIVLPLQCIQASNNADLWWTDKHNRLHPITHILESLDAAPPVTLATRSWESSTFRSSSCFSSSSFFFPRRSLALIFAYKHTAFNHSNPFRYWSNVAIIETPGTVDKYQKAYS